MPIKVPKMPLFWPIWLISKEYFLHLQLTVHKHDQCIIVLRDLLHLNLGICFNSTFQLDEPNYLDISD